MKQNIRPIQYFEEARSMMFCAGFNLRTCNWVSNCESLNRKSQDDQVASSSHLANVLGLQWNTTTDQLSITSKRIHTTDKQLTTKRQVDACKLFDPFGIASPVSVCAKLIMQKLWQLHIKWDEPSNSTTTEEWGTIINDIQ